MMSSGYRDRAGNVVYTEKVWVASNGTYVRREVECTTTRGEFQAAVSKYPDAVHITKWRDTYAGTYRDKEVTIDMDVEVGPLTDRAILHRSGGTDFFPD